MSDPSQLPPPAYQSGPLPQAPLLPQRGEKAAKVFFVVVLLLVLAVLALVGYLFLTF
jgi:hypothetical protein